MNSKPSDLDAFLNLPSDPQGRGNGDDPKKRKHLENEAANPAAEAIRHKVEAVYKSEPSAEDELAEISAMSADANASKHQKYVQSLIQSGKSLEQIQAGWHDYYLNLPDDEKHEVWQEFYAAQASVPEKPVMASALPTASAEAKPAEPLVKMPPLGESASQAIHKIARKIKQKKVSHRPVRPKSAAHSVAFGIAVGAVVLVIFLFSFFNERFIAPFIQPSRSLSNVPLISGAAVGPQPEVIIPKINVEIPVVYGVDTISEESIDNALESGVVHYADTALPGQNGNVVIVGHSSNNIFNKGRYKFAFVLLSRLEPGDTFYLQKDGQRYTYQVYKKQIVKPTDVSILGPADRPATATLVTCDPPGTSINRLVVTGEQISPPPNQNSAAVSPIKTATSAKIIPGNSQSLWARFTHWLTQ